MALPERITLVDCIKLQAARTYNDLSPVNAQGLRQYERNQTKRDIEYNQATSTSVSRDKLRQIFENVMDILNDLPIDSDNDE